MRFCYSIVEAFTICSLHLQVSLRKRLNTLRNLTFLSKYSESRQCSLVKQWMDIYCLPHSTNQPRQAFPSMSLANCLARAEFKSLYPSSEIPNYDS